MLASTVGSEPIVCWDVVASGHFLGTLINLGEGRRSEGKMRDRRKRGGDERSRARIVEKKRGSKRNRR